MDVKKHVLLLIVVCCVFSLFLTVGCKKAEYDAIVFDDIDYVTEFPDSSTLTGGIPFADGVIGKYDFMIYDSLMFITTRFNHEAVKIVSLKNGKCLKGMIDIGHGRNEFDSKPIMSVQASFYKDNDSLYCIMSDFHPGTSFRINITETLNSDTLAIEKNRFWNMRDIYDYVMLDSVYSDDATFMTCSSGGFNGNIPIGFESRGKQKATPKNVERLNDYKIDITKGDCSILSNVLRYNRKNNVIVNAMLYFNYFNIVKLDDSFAKTVCIEERIQEVKDYDKGQEYERCITDVEMFDDFFAVFVVRPYKNAILFFSYDGKPLYKLKCDEGVDFFAVDTRNEDLYLFYYEQDKIKKCNISPIFNKCKKYAKKI